MYKANLNFETIAAVIFDEVAQITYETLELERIQKDVGLEPWDEITGAITISKDGSYLAVYFCESGTPWLTSTNWHPLPYYKTEVMRKNLNLEEYWNDDNDWYCLSGLAKLLNNKLLKKLEAYND